MLMNGQKVNYLILNGEKFTSENAFPFFACYPKADTSTTAFEYELYYEGLTPKFKRKFENDIFKVELIDPNKVLVTDFMTFNGEEYVKIYANRKNYGGNWTQYANAWVKSDAFGGFVKLDIGGKNKPSYLLFIYYVKEVAPSC